jgi:hypothetical protein
MSATLRHGSRAAKRIGLVMAAAGLLIVGCHASQPLGPPTPTGATILGGSTMASTPAPPPGWNVHVVTPESQQQAQETVLGYLRKTLSALPPGTVIDGSRYGSAGSTAPCEDKPHSQTELFSSVGDLKPPEGTDPAHLVGQIGDIWKSWGWWVFERDGTYKPNRSGYSPDGYELQVAVPAVPGPPSIIGNSPCFPRELVREDLPFPTKIAAGNS